MCLTTLFKRMPINALFSYAFAGLVFTGGLAVEAQDANGSKPIPSIPLLAGPEALGSNLGVQEIVEIPQAAGKSKTVKRAEDAKDPSSVPSKLKVSTTAGVRAYRTSNVMRVESETSGSAVLEFNLGANLGTAPVTMFGKPVAPSLTLMSQRAYYGQFSVRGGDLEKGVVKDVLDYEFRMVNLAAATKLSENWSVTGALEYDELRSFRTDEKKYHAFSPILSLSRMKPLSDASMLAFDANLRYAFTKTISTYKIPGVFEDDGDNWQTGVTLTYVRVFGPDGRLMVLPSLGLTSTSYVKNDHSGRVDYLWTGGLSATYQLTEHFGIQTFLTYGNKSANAKGREKLENSRKYENLDLGISITGQYAF